MNPGAPAFADLHLHLGRTGDGRPVKVTASGAMDLSRVLETARGIKGLDLVAVVDAAAPGVRRDIDFLVDRGEMAPLAGGGYLTSGGLGFIPAVEVEVGAGSGGSAHLILYLPDRTSLEAVSRWLAVRVANPHLSTQRVRSDPAELAAVAAAEGGFAVVAHLFTPYKGLLGRPGAPSPAALAGDSYLPAVELGLSADSELADRLPELASLSFLSNSDAHSLGTVAREYMALELEELSLHELRLALDGPGGSQGRRIRANYGLDPRLGKYHRTWCQHCARTAGESPPILECPLCGNPEPVVGVLDRVMERSGSAPVRAPAGRPPYVHQVPLAGLPGIGPAARRVLLEAFGTEMAVLHRAEEADLAGVVGEDRANLIARARRGELCIRPGGGGHYGRVVKNPCRPA